MPVTPDGNQGHCLRWKSAALMNYLALSIYYVCPTFYEDRLRQLKMVVEQEANRTGPGNRSSPIVGGDEVLFAFSSIVCDERDNFVY